MKLKEAARKAEDGIEETLTYCDFPGEHWTRIRTNNVIERLDREIRHRTRVEVLPLTLIRQFKLPKSEFSKTFRQTAGRIPA